MREDLPYAFAASRRTCKGWTQIPDCQDLVEKRTDAERELSSEQIEAVMTALYGAGRYGIAQGGHVSFNHARQPTFIVDISLTFPQVKDT